MARFPRVFVLLLPLLLIACSSGTPQIRPETLTAEDTLIPRVQVGPTALRVADSPPAEPLALAVGLVIFDPGLPEDENRGRELGIFPEVRNAEASFLPYVLRDTLVRSGQWGAARVLPEDDVSTELKLRGRIIRSDGARLALEIEASDASGRNWVRRVYEARSTEPAISAQQGELISQGPFDSLFNRIANDLLEKRRALDAAELKQVRELSFLRYAAALAPEAFARYLEPDGTGGYRYRRLPSSDDPMVRRIRKVQAQEHVFIDTMDDQYFELYSAMAPTYRLWRQYNREQVLYQEAKESSIKERETYRKGSYLAMKDSYNRYRWAKLQQQELKELARGFENEVAPTAVELEGRVVQLNGSLEQRYRDWRRILRKIYELEVGTDPNQ